MDARDTKEFLVQYAFGDSLEYLGAYVDTYYCRITAKTIGQAIAVFRDNVDDAVVLDVVDMDSIQKMSF